MWYFEFVTSRRLPQIIWITNTIVMINFRWYLLSQICLGLLFFAVSKQVYSQLDNNNTVKVNSANSLLLGSKAFIFGYEWVIGNHPSLSVSIGRMLLPAFLNKEGHDSIKLQNNTSEKGLNISADYRFYLSKENKYDASSGIYLALLFLQTFTPYKYMDRKYFFHSGQSRYYNCAQHQYRWRWIGLSICVMEKNRCWHSVRRARCWLLPDKTSVNENLNTKDKQMFYRLLNDYLKDNIPGCH